tara:strand:+ start:468 stop:692 length:225 start_codon:yes stop_codon:yes gene_type:complete
MKKTGFKMKGMAFKADQSPMRKLSLAGIGKKVGSFVGKVVKNKANQVLSKVTGSKDTVGDIKNIFKPGEESEEE